MIKSEECFGAGNAALALEAECSLRAQGEIGGGVSASRQSPESRTYASQRRQEGTCRYCGALDNGTCAYPSEGKPGCFQKPQSRIEETPNG